MKHITLPDDILDTIETFGYPMAHGADFRAILKKTRFTIMPKPLRGFYRLFHAPIWGGCYKRYRVWINKDAWRRVCDEPWHYADEVWHELWHCSQRKHDGDFMFNLRYIAGLIGHFGKWRKIGYEREAFREQDKFREAAE